MEVSSVTIVGNHSAEAVKTWFKLHESINLEWNEMMSYRNLKILSAIVGVVASMLTASYYLVMTGKALGIL